MPFQRPTLTDLHAQVAADIESRLPGADGQLRRSILGVLSRTLAGALHGLHGFLAFTARQVFPDTAEAEFLERWAGIWGIARKPAWPAQGGVTVAGADGSVIPSGTELHRGDGALYRTREEGTIAAGAATVAVRAAVPGSAGNAEPGAKLTLVAPIAGARSTAAVADNGSGGGLTQGSDAEADAALLARLLRRIQQPPHGGARGDYITWALDRAGHGLEATRAWVYPLELGLGAVTLRFMMDDTYSDGIPRPADVAVLQDYIDRMRPVTAVVTVVAPIPAPLRFEISRLDPALQAVREAIAAELHDLIRREAEPGGTLLISHVREAISIAAGEHDHALAAPTADVTHATGRIATFGGIAWR